MTILDEVGEHKAQRVVGRKTGDVGRVLIVQHDVGTLEVLLEDVLCVLMTTDQVPDRGLPSLEFTLREAVAAADVQGSVDMVEIVSDKRTAV